MSISNDVTVTAQVTQDIFSHVWQQKYVEPKHNVTLTPAQAFCA